VLYITNFCCD